MNNLKEKFEKLNIEDKNFMVKYEELCKEFNNIKSLLSFSEYKELEKLSLEMLEKRNTFIDICMLNYEKQEKVALLISTGLLFLTSSLLGFI